MTKKEEEDVEMAPLKEVSLQDSAPSSPTRPSSSSRGSGSTSVVTACLMYAFCSVSMVLTNKSLASG